mmetsp:Transcript_63569/g.200860  ORF Transcript_63569/g.200860 Transcript_63569/m.200860 type:complete len:684 (+) Transcript_63569:39-2090(+)
MVARRGLCTLVTAVWLWRPSSAALVCEACQALASAALRHFRQPSPVGLAAALESELRAGGLQELQHAALHAGLARERLAERCEQFLRADRPVLARLSRSSARAAGGGSPSWREVRDALCVQKLRCPSEGIWAVPDPWAAAGTSSEEGPAKELAEEADELLPDTPEPEVRAGAGPRATYERMLEEYSAVAGVWEPREAAATAPEPPGRGAEELRAAAQTAPNPVQGEAEEPKGAAPAAPPEPTRGEPEVGACNATDGAPAGTVGGKEAKEASRLAAPAPDGSSVSAAARARRGPRRQGSAAAEREVDEDDGPEDPLEPRCRERRDSYGDLASVRVVAVVFCGRRDRLRILLRYLGRDLRRSGGVVDRVILARWQHTRGDLDFLERVVAGEGGSGAFEIRDFSEETWGPPREGADPQTNRMVRLYQSLDEPDAVYVKIDDDVVYIAPHAIANLVREVRRGRCLFVSGNVVNHAIMSSLHQDRGAHRGFWPSQEQLRQPWQRRPWHKHSQINLSPDFRFERHPVARCVVERWDCAALVHESFLDRAADGTLCAFDFGWHDFNRGGFREHRYTHRSPSIDKEYAAEGARWSTNFFAFTKASLDGVNWQAIYGKGDDEEEFTGPHSQRREEHSCAVGAALSVHFSYGSQEEGLMANTDLLRRYDKLSRRLVPSQGQGARAARGKRSAV